MSLFFFFWIASLPVLVLSADSTLNDDVLGLIVFKADLEDPAGSLSSWNEDDKDPCDWSGVKCDPRSGRVAELRLDGFSLSGKIGRGLFQISSLQVLSLSRNNFSGGISSFSAMGNLREVDLSENDLSGEIPEDFFAQCRSLRSVSLAKNGFSGQIPASLGSCSTLASLNLSSNQLTGFLPENIWWLNALRNLDLSFNLLSGEIPPGIEKMYNLRSIDFRGNRFSGSLPGEIGGCLLLKSVDLGENSLSGVLPDSMRKLSLCTELRLGRNSFAGEIPPWIGELSSLEFLDISSNEFTGEIPNTIGNLLQLRELDFSMNELTGNLPETIANCGALSEVDFSDNNLSGELQPWIFELGLKQISVSGNKLAGNLQIPNPALHADGLPLGSASILSLRQLNLSRNLFSGNIPATIAELAAVETLDLSSNRFSGGIPPEIGNLAALRELHLERNSLSGKIPAAIENCTFLSTLVLAENKLSGGIPPNLANLTNLQVVDISKNKLSGYLPKQLGDLPHLISFNISFNLFAGDLPSGNFFNTIPSSSVTGNPSLCGAAVNSSCPATLPKPIVLDPSSSSPENPNSNPPSRARHKKLIFSISVLIAIAAAALIAVGVAAVTVLNIRAVSATNSAAALALSESGGGASSSSSSGNLVMFSGESLEPGAHTVLNKDCELGRGGFGAVYKTTLQNGRHVAVKKLTVSGLVKSKEEFHREVSKLGKLLHPNLVAMEGFFWTPSVQLLIYEYFPRGSLSSLLHGGDEVLTWRERFDFIVGAAKGLTYLHRMGVVHYNVKSTNVLVNGEGVAKVGDYGLARLLPVLDRYVLSSRVQSALGYVAPEAASGSFTEKSDVYGFGVLVLEVVTGRRPVEYEEDVVVLADVARGVLEEGRILELVDGRLDGRFPAEEAAPLIKLGLICTSHVPSNRPEMGEVVGLLEMIRFPVKAREFLHLSRFFHWLLEGEAAAELELLDAVQRLGDGAHGGALGGVAAEAPQRGVRHRASRRRREPAFQPGIHYQRQPAIVG